MIRPLVKMLRDDRELRFWFCQLVGWIGYSIATFLTITLVDDNVSWIHVGHIALSAMLGVLTSWPLRPIYQYTFEMPLTVRIVVAGISVVIFAALWTVSRIQVFAWLVDEPPLWNEVNYWYFGSLFVFLSWTVLYYGIKYYDLLTTEHEKLLQETAGKRSEQMLRLRAEAEAHEAQLRMLHYQLAPHFLFNTLNAINALVRLGEVQRAQEMIQLLGDFLRHALKQEAMESITLEQEVESLSLYLNIEKARFEDRLKLSFDLDPATLHAHMTALLLQPIVENAMKYAISESEDGGTLSISSRLVGDRLQLEIADTGPGYEPEEGDDRRGIGMRNVIDRLHTLYGEEHQFLLSKNAPSGLKVTIEIPAQFPPEAANNNQAHEELSVAQA